jgi:hypothetical protein
MRVLALLPPREHLGLARAEQPRLAGFARKKRMRPGPREGVWSARDIALSTDAEGRTILLNLRSGTYLGLDAAAVRIVHLLNENPDPEAAASLLARHFGVSQQHASKDVAAVIASVNGLRARRSNHVRRPSVDGTRTVLRSWKRQGWRFRLTILQATSIVVFVEIGLKLTNLQRVAKWLKVPLGTASSTVPITDAPSAGFSCLNEDEKRASWAVIWVMRRWLYDDTCLRMALAQGWFFRHRQPVLRLGMLEDKVNVAHAWIEVGGLALNAQGVTSAFASLASTSNDLQRQGAMDLRSQ